LRLHGERAGWSPSEVARAAAAEGTGLPRIDFVAEADHCGGCGGPLAVQKSKTRKVVTLAEGAFEAREVLKHCDRPGCATNVGSEVLRGIVRPRQRYGYDLVVHVGLARYLGGKQRDEIRQQLLEQRGIELSSGTIRVVERDHLEVVRPVFGGPGDVASCPSFLSARGYAGRLPAFVKHLPSENGGQLLAGRCETSSGELTT
jgi:hypothetical protein